MTDATGHNATCANCPFGTPSIGQGGQVDFQTRACRRYPPSPIVMHLPQGIRLDFAYPTMKPDHWCGEHPGRKPSSIELPAKMGQIIAGAPTGLLRETDGGAKN